MKRRIQNHAQADIQRQLSLAGQAVKEANAIYRRGGEPQALDMLQRLLFRMGALNAIATDSTVSSGSHLWMRVQGAQSAVGDAIDKMRRTAGVVAPRERYYKAPGVKLRGELKREVRLQSRVANPAALDFPVAMIEDTKATGLWVDRHGQPRHPLNANFTVHGPLKDGQPHPKAVAAQARVAAIVAEHQARDGGSKPTDDAIDALTRALLKARVMGTDSQIERFAKQALKAKKNPRLGAGKRKAARVPNPDIFAYADVNKYLKAVKAEQRKALKGTRIVWDVGSVGGVKTWTGHAHGAMVIIYAPYGGSDLYQVYAAKQGKGHGEHFSNAKSIAEAKRVGVEAAGYYGGVAPNAMGKMKTNPKLPVKAGDFDAPVKHRSGWGYYRLTQRRDDGALDKGATFYAPDDDAARAYAPRCVYDGSQAVRLERARPYDTERSQAAWTAKYRGAR